MIQFHLSVFFDSGMDALTGQTVKPLHDHGPGGDGDVTSWVSVCPRGLWKVQQKRSEEACQQTASTSGEDACRRIFYYLYFCY